MTLVRVRVQDEIDLLKKGARKERTPGKPRIDFITQASGERVQLPDISRGTTEELVRPQDSGEVFLDRRDVWAADGWDADPMLFRRP